MRLPACHADERDQWGLVVLEDVLVKLIRGFRTCNCNMIFWRWVLNLLSHARENVDGNSIKDW